MGVPLFEILRELVRHHAIVVKSSNYPLERDLLDRFHTAVALFFASPGRIIQY